LSLLEARRNDDILLRLMKAIQLDVLKRNITDIYELFMDLYDGAYKEEIFNHVS
jgi:hypothetical protein